MRCSSKPIIRWCCRASGGYSKKSLREQASYYYSQPFFKARGRLSIDDKPVEVSGLAWMDREWSSQPLAPDQKGWDWFALHFCGRREADAVPDAAEPTETTMSPATGSLLDGAARQLGPADIKMTPGAPIDIDGHKLPVRWQIAIPSALRYRSNAAR